MRDLKIKGVILPGRDSKIKWDLEIENSMIKTIRWSQEQRSVSGGVGNILLPALCHPHIHLDKAYILTCNHYPSANHPDYSDLAPTSGSFQEALSNTSEAKKRYSPDDLYLRGSQLLATSYKQGVTALRAFVEIDHVTGTATLETAIKLKADFAHLIEVQICTFAQDPIISGDYAESNRAILQSALENFGSAIDVLGTTPYVESSSEDARKNIDWAVATALRYSINLDFHLDYNLDSSSTTQPMIYTVIGTLQKHGWVDTADISKTIVLGHCTQLSTLRAEELRNLAEKIKRSKIPIHFVGLPTSDLYMMGRHNSDEPSSTPHTRPRGTLQVPSLINDYGLSACIGVNNVGNAFTPYGSGDPLQLASYGVGIYHAGTTNDAKTLYSCVSWGARKAIGLDVAQEEGNVAEGDKWQPMLLIKNEQYLDLPSKLDDNKAVTVLARPRLEYKDVVWDPPETQLRSVVT